LNKLKKVLSILLPKGRFKNKIKNFYYNFFAPKGIQYTLVGYQGNIFKTNFQAIELLSVDPLYHIAPDFSYYTHFYKIKPDDVVLDAGANRGYISLFFSLTAPNVQVHAFEPDIQNLSLIKKNMELNPKCCNISISDLLLWDKEEEIDFCESGSVASSAHWMPEPNKIVKKKTTTVDIWVQKNNIQKLNFIKMDIEGAEIEALNGCVETIKKFNPHFAIASYHVVNGAPTYLALEAFFDTIKYPYKTIAFKSNEIITFAGPNVR
jgi:FkbM family methyltransferase